MTVIFHPCSLQVHFSLKHLLRCEPLLLEFQLGFEFVWCLHLPAINQGPWDLSHDPSFCLFSPSLTTRDAVLSWPETKFRSHVLGDLLPLLPFSLLDMESKVIDKKCTKENETFKLKAKGDEMKIWCSTIEESESTGTNPFLRNKEEGYGAFKQQILMDWLLFKIF